MYTLPAMPRQKTEDVDRVNFQLWLRGDAAKRYDEVLRRAKNRQPRANNAHVNGRLLGLEPDTDGLVTEADRQFFQNGSLAQIQASEVDIRLADDVTERRAQHLSHKKTKPAIKGVKKRPRK